MLVTFCDKLSGVIIVKCTSYPEWEPKMKQPGLSVVAAIGQLRDEYYSGVK
jgi:hypothetical protein